MSNDYPDFEHEIFGTFTYDEHNEYYRADTIWSGQSIWLLISKDEKTHEHQLALGQILWESQEHWNQYFRDKLINQMRHSKQPDWQEFRSRNPSVSDSEFQERMRIGSIILLSRHHYMINIDDVDDDITVTIEGHFRDDVERISAEINWF